MGGYIDILPPSQQNLLITTLLLTLEYGLTKATIRVLSVAATWVRSYQSNGMCALYCCQIVSLQLCVVMLLSFRRSD